MSEKRKVFADYEAFDSFVDGRRVNVAKTTNGKQVLTINRKVVATIKDDLKGATIQETAKKLRSINLVVGIPYEGSVDNQDRRSLPCVMENNSEWEEVAL